MRRCLMGDKTYFELLFDFIVAVNIFFVLKIFDITVLSTADLLNFSYF